MTGLTNSGKSRFGTERSAEFLHENTCGLEEEGHRINEKFIHVVKQAQQKAPIPCEFFASGCSTCTPNLDPGTAAIFYVAQGSAEDTVHLSFDIISDDSTEEHGRNTEIEVEDVDETFSVKDLGSLIKDAAETLGVQVSWAEKADQSVCLGTDKAYYTFPPGQKVESTETHNDWTATTIEANDEDWCPEGYTKIRFNDGGEAIKSSRRLNELSEEEDT